MLHVYKHVIMHTHTPTNMYTCARTHKQHTRHTQTAHTHTHTHTQAINYNCHYSQTGYNYHDILSWRQINN